MVNYIYNYISILKQLYPFIDVFSIGKSVMGKDILAIKLGNGANSVFYSASIHANEWITSFVLLKFVDDFCFCYKNNIKLNGYSVNSIFNDSSIYIVPLVNPDGVALVTGDLSSTSPLYNQAEKIASEFATIPFPDGWKANIRGVDLNLQFPTEWQKAREIKYSQGFTRSCSS